MLHFAPMRYPDNTASPSFRDGALGKDVREAVGEAPSILNTRARVLRRRLAASSSFRTAPLSVDKEEQPAPTAPQVDRLSLSPDSFLFARSAERRASRPTAHEMCDAAPTDGAESKRLELKPVCMAPRRGGGTVFKATDATARAGGSVAVDSAARSTMSKTFHRRSTAACGLVVLMLLLCSVGLLIAFLKGHQQQTRDAHMRQGATPRRGVNNDGGNFPSRRTTQPPSTTTTPRPPLQTTTVEPPKPKLDFRLPTHVVPLAYDLMLEPHLSRDTFDGEVWIMVNATRPVNRFVVHVFRLTVDETEVLFEDGSPLSTGPPFEDDLNEFFVVPVADKPGPAGLYRLHFKFRGSLVGGIVGFYKSSYKIDNEIR
ncbi:hypothetical protein HPB51_014362 [Rhipicephalus microplus]|uniref:Aminopeptidase N-like N-terminal domain-containing protein n=1 Tax=Rhipicephalus microplus TaxID=6941 RepID=A0A9J6EGS5_RHIMP|nr:hypothetical protein HPB51_014362 [Rhipicephalus microplus]